MKTFSRDAALSMLEAYIDNLNDSSSFGWAGSEDDYEGFLAYVESDYAEQPLGKEDRDLLIDVYVDAFRSAEP